MAVSFVVFRYAELFRLPAAMVDPAPGPLHW
jgi:hypothetical protein